MAGNLDRMTQNLLRPPLQTPPRTWVQLLAVDSQLSYRDPWDFAGWLRSGQRSVFLPPSFRGAALALFATSLPALLLAAAQLAAEPSALCLPWFICSFLAGLWAFHEVPGSLRVTPSAFVTVAAFSTVGFHVGVWCATIAAVSSWGASGGAWRRSNGYRFLANWANLVLSAAAGAMVFEAILGVQHEAGLAAALTSDRFLLAFPAGLAAYVLVNTSLASLGAAARGRTPLASTWRACYSAVGLLFSIGVLQVFSFIIAFGCWGGLAVQDAGTVIAFLLVLILLGAGKQCVFQHEAREHITCLAGLLSAAARPDSRKHPFAVHLLDGLLAQGTRRFLSGIPPEELTFEAEEAILDAEIAWKLGASEHSIRSFLTQHETPDGSGPFGLRELGLPVWSPAFPEKTDPPPKSNGPGERSQWDHRVLRCLLDAANPPDELCEDNRKWNRLALSGARTVHSILERFDFGRRLNPAEDLQWWTMCELVGFGSPSEPEPLAGTQGSAPQVET